jgi:hypothetical protein
MLNVVLLIAIMLSAIMVQLGNTIEQTVNTNILKAFNKALIKVYKPNLSNLDWLY